MILLSFATPSLHLESRRTSIVWVCPTSWMLPRSLFCPSPFPPGWAVAISPSNPLIHLDKTSNPPDSGTSGTSFLLSSLHGCPLLSLAVYSTFILQWCHENIKSWYFRTYLLPSLFCLFNFLYSSGRGKENILFQRTKKFMHKLGIVIFTRHCNLRRQI